VLVLFLVLLGLVVLLTRCACLLVGWIWGGGSCPVWSRRVTLFYDLPLSSSPGTKLKVQVDQAFSPIRGYTGVHAAPGGTSTLARRTFILTLPVVFGWALTTNAILVHRTCHLPYVPF
jgi:hypothetical protein